MTQSQRIAVVTGAAGGIGLAVARQLADNNCLVVCVDRDGAGAEAVAAEVVGEARTADVAHSGECKAIIQSVSERHGRIDILINNAGLQRVAPLHEIPDDSWGLLDVMLSGPFYLMRAALLAMSSAWPTSRIMPTSRMTDAR